MGVAATKNCDCISAVYKVANSLWHVPSDQPCYPILDEDDMVPANLLSEQEIQYLLSDDGKTYETV